MISWAIKEPQNILKMNRTLHLEQVALKSAVKFYNQNALTDWYSWTTED